MPLRRTKFILLALTLCLLSGTALAENNVHRSKLGVDVRAFKPAPLQDYGWLAGLRWAEFFGDSEVYWGLAAYFGSPQGGPITSEHIAMAGLMTGYEHSLGKSTFLEVDLMIGYGQGKSTDLNIDQKSYYVIQPGLAFGFRLGGGWKIALTTNYIQMNHAPEFSGFAAGLRFEFKSQTTSKALNR